MCTACRRINVTADMLTNSFLMCEHFPEKTTTKTTMGKSFRHVNSAVPSLRYSTQGLALKKFDVLRPAYQNISKRAIEKLMSQSSRQFLQYSFFAKKKFSTVLNKKRIWKMAIVQAVNPHFDCIILVHRSNLLCNIVF